MSQWSYFEHYQCYKLKKLKLMPSSSTGDLAYRHRIMLESYSVHEFVFSSCFALFCEFITLLTLFRPVDLSILINWQSKFPNSEVSGVNFHFYVVSNRNGVDPDQTSRFAASDLGLDCLPKSQG